MGGRDPVKYLPFVLRNLIRNKLRSLLTGAAIALAIALVCILRTMPAGIDAFLDSITSNTRVSTHNQAGMFYGMPHAYLRKVRAVPGVVAAISWQWFGGTVDPAEGVAFPSFAVDPEEFGVVYADWHIAPEALETFRRYRDAALVGRQTMTSQSWKVGDIVSLESTVFPVTLSFRIVGEVPNESSPQLYLQREYLVQALRAKGVSLDVVEMITSRIDDPLLVQSVMLQIDQMFSNSESETTSETERGFFLTLFGSLQGVVTIILIVAGVVTLCVAFIAANTVSMAVRERERELAILKAIGFRRRTIFATVLAEAVVLSTAGGLAGVLISLGLTAVLRSGAGGSAALGTAQLTGFVVTEAIQIQAMFIALLVGILAGLLPALRASKHSVAEKLRESL